MNTQGCDARCAARNRSDAEDRRLKVFSDSIRGALDRGWKVSGSGRGRTVATRGKARIEVRGDDPTGQRIAKQIWLFDSGAAVDNAIRRARLERMAGNVAKGRELYETAMKLNEDRENLLRSMKQQ